MLWNCFTWYASKFGRLSSGHRTGMSVFIPIPKKGSAKECSNYCTIALISHASKVMLKISQASSIRELWSSRCWSWIKKSQRNQRSNCQHLLDHRKSKTVPEKHLLLLNWLSQSLWLCGSQQTVESSPRDGNTRPPDLPLRNLYAGQEATVRTVHGTTDWFQIRKGVCHNCILSLCLFNLYAEYIMRNAGLDEAWAGIKIAERNITSDMQMTKRLRQ